MPDRVRESLFSILGDQVYDRPFFDLFAGTGAIGLEALSRGARPVSFVERDGRVAGEISKHLKLFGVNEVTSVHRADVYRWAEHWQAPTEPVIIFLGPPYPHLSERREELMRVIELLQDKVPPESVLILQSEKEFDPGTLPQMGSWQNRHYGRTQLSIWTKGI
jgi:16S rRNA (guanine(966)-N(2))-methyltransferase RsmD